MSNSLPQEQPAGSEQHTAQHEATAARLAAFFNAETEHDDDPPLRWASEGDTTVQLTAEQEIAVDRSVRVAVAARTSGQPSYLTVTGAAGTGKTHTTRAIKARLERSGFRVGAAAPTHKAAGVLRAAVGLDAITFASLLGLGEQIEEHKARFVPKNKPRLSEADVWLLDESSMMHPQLLELLQTGARNGAKKGFVHAFIFIGDPSQIPPVGHEGLSPALMQPDTTELTKVHRHAGPVLRLATDIRCGEELRPPLTASVMAADSSVVVHPDRAAWWKAFITAAGTAKCADDARLLAFTNRAVSQCNAYARKHFRGADAPPFLAGEFVVTYSGTYSIDDLRESHYNAEPIHGTSRELVIGSAEPLRLLFDGHASGGLEKEHVNDLGISEMRWFLRTYEFNAWKIFAKDSIVPFYVLDASSRPLHKQLCAYLKENRRWCDYWMLVRGFASLQPHYALTVHKSQGSQFKHVFVDVENIETAHKTSEDGKRALLYTAITRAQETVHVIADQPALDMGWLF